MTARDLQVDQLCGAPPAFCPHCGGALHGDGEAPAGGAAAAARPVAEARPRGRPRKRTAAFYERLLQEHQEIAAWFVREYGMPPPSIRHLYQQRFRHVFRERGEQEGKVDATAFQRWLKTRMNLLSEAKRMFRVSQ